MNSQSSRRNILGTKEITKATKNTTKNTTKKHYKKTLQKTLQNTTKKDYKKRFRTESAHSVQNTRGSVKYWVILLMQNGKVPCGQNWPNVPNSFFLPLCWTLHRAVQYLLEYIYLTLQTSVSYVNWGCGKRSTG